MSSLNHKEPLDLSRKEWLDMWNNAILIERNLNEMKNSVHKDMIRKEVDKIKEYIQSVIGQME